ncbi:MULTISPECIES: crotonase/enoyl-CoA hydratase family protein [unclassified Psychrobacter]|uniref:crotonase/enoyl-CoA hydratase family protein n=1 Tax=unclassified Psychrobacter TaxID=196806 RepID=UPI0025B4993C|nr:MULTISPECIES: crotonase/enoyl-CoA hydratase family protein [unclassified Psychrobacter]MDN3452295.1 crotonase/enoyl-CoA hydratase family protein [Psychrobacter sp. APC 3350]MDN3502783.1 crotonase/enoyl-CoA hydratase family protein [Psychrobacter sp. 5A.1]
MKAIASYQYKTLQVSITDNILTVTLNRPQKKNAMSFQLIDELITVAGRINKDRTIRAVILNGAEETFCAGIDLSDLNHPKNKAFALWELVKPWQSSFQRVCLVWRDLPVPVIAVLEGYCIGAGLQLALACDIRISHPDCKLSIMEAKWGLVPDMGLTQSAFGVVREDTLKELAMSARIIDANEGKSLGLISHCNDAPLEQAKELAAEFAERSPDAVLASKRIINAMHHQPCTTLYKEKAWQLKMMLGRNRKLALRKAKQASTIFGKRQFQ